jgi:Uma2 family endonuclease
MDNKQKETICTYEDYLSIDSSERYELIEGQLYAMSSPSTEHQWASMSLSIQLGTFLLDKPCLPFAAPYDVLLDIGKSKDTILQPDIIVICDRSKIVTGKCVGAPDIVIEILSPSTASFDKGDKKEIYRRNGVREYWIVDTNKQNVTTHILDRKKRYRSKIYAYRFVKSIPMHCLPGCYIDLDRIFNY